MTVRYEARDGVAILTLDNPPVNALGLGTRIALVEAVDRAQDDDAVSAIVLTGAGSAFSAGADIRELNTPRALQAPSLRKVLEVVESSLKPVIAAVQSVALGGGLELALVAHYRLAAPGAQIGLPEVRLGILPAAGGTQRLPRAVGLETGLNMIVAGKPVKSEELAGTRLFDGLIEGDLLEAALAFAKEVVTRSSPHPRVREWKIEHANAEGFLASARIATAASSKSFPAPLKCIDAIEAAVTRPFDEGLRVEAEAFTLLVESPESRALRHVFFAERAAARLQKAPATIAVRAVESIAVIGAGTMGAGIAACFLNSGIPVTLIDVGRETLDQAIAKIRQNYLAAARKGKLSAEQVEQRMVLLRPALRYEQLRDSDLVIEAVFEDYGAKEAVFRQLDAIAKPGAILATNTSSLDLNRLASATSRPEDVVGMHFFSPAHVMRLLEVVRGARTGNDVLATVMSLAARIGKVSVVVGVCDGFIGNRMIEQYVRQAGFLLDEGASPQQVDSAMEAFGFAMGPFRMSDLAGNDIGFAIRKRRAAKHPELAYSKTADLVCERGRFGQKSGAGWYDYKPGDRTAYRSELVEELVIEHSRTLGLERRAIMDDEIVGRLVCALVNEGAKALEEGIAARASDIDLVYLYGYGFPLWRGGPMLYADTVGLYNVLRAIRGYAKGYQGQSWQPAGLLIRLVESGGTFNE